MAAPDSPAPEYVPAVYYADPEKVDSETGNPWHLVTQNPELRRKVYAGEVVPVTAAAFAQKQAAASPK